MNNQRLLSSSQPTLSLDAAPKYKNGISGSRYRSKGEINSKARKYTNRKTTSKNGRTTATTSDIARRKPVQTDPENGGSRDVFRYTVRKYYTKPPVVKEKIFSIIDIKANGCLLIGGCQNVVYEKEEQTTVTLTGADIPRTTNVPLKTVAVIATSVSGEEVICKFHGVAHIVHPTRNEFILSRAQMESNGTTFFLKSNDLVGANLFSGVKCVTVDNHTFPIKRCSSIFGQSRSKTAPFIEFKETPISKHQWKHLKEVDMTSPGVWNPPANLSTRSGCSFCGSKDCRRL